MAEDLKPKNPFESANLAEKLQQEQETSPESLEQGPESLEKVLEGDSEGAKSNEKKGEAAVVSPVKPRIVTDSEKERERQIEAILSDGLGEIYLSLPDKNKEEFKKSGEEAVVKINELMSKAKINISKIIKVIRDWLSKIPKVNKFFLEQEAKIKADKIIKLKK